MSGGKTYQVAQVDPLNPHTKGMVYQVSIVGGGTQMEELPEATADNVGMVFQYLGESDANFTHGYFYENKAQGTNPETYAWEAIDTQAGGAISTANTDLSNLTSTGKNIANWSSNVSNCILEIPQDIKLELNAGALTLKAGSKVYVPNGSGVFDAYTLPSDSATTPSMFSTSTGRFVILDPNKNFNVVDVTASYIFSGTTAPTVFDGNGKAYWYDTTNNVIKRTQNSGTTWVSGYSFPIAIVDITNGVGVSKINQVFNGFGFIGVTAFVLPGLKALVPAGLNEDGTLKSELATRTTVGVTTFVDTNARTVGIIKGVNAGISGFYGRPYFQENYPGTNYKYWYKQSTNRVYNSQTSQGAEIVSNSTWLFYFDPVTGDCAFNNVFHALDFNPEAITTMSMPSLRYIDLTLGVSGSYYKAKADGYYIISKGALVDGEFITMINTTTGFGVDEFLPSSKNARLFIPVAKGESIQINYDLTGTTNFFRFVYANGAQ